MLGLAKKVADTGVLDMAGRTAEDRVCGLQALVMALESGVRIFDAHERGAPQPFPGAVRAVLDQCLTALDLSRKVGLVPDR
jgi:hypothetical protein